MKKILKRIDSLEYESQVLALICGVGMFRILVELILDFVEKNRVEVVAINFSIFSLILSLLYVCIKNKYKNIHFIFGVLITVLLASLILFFGGIHGYGKFNYYSSLYLLVMVYSGHTLIRLLVLNFVTLITVIVIGILSPPWLSIIDRGSTYSRLDFWFTLIMLSGFSFYLKWITISKGGKLSALNKTMAEQVGSSRKLGVMVQNTNLELKQTQARLEAEVSARTTILEKKNESVEAFIKLNTTELIEAVDDLLISMRELDGDSLYKDKIILSSEELAVVMENIRVSLQQDGWINRQAVRNHER